MDSTNQRRFSARALGSALAGLVVAGCMEGRVLGGDGEPGSTGAASSTSTGVAGSTSAAASTDGTTGTVGSSSTTDAADDDSSPASVGFLVPADAGGGSFECNMFTQDCPPGQKCSPYGDSPELSNSWNGWKCTPLAEDPLPPGESCHSEGGPTSGTDDCERGAICYDADPDTLEGVCVSICEGTLESEDYFCEDPSTLCHIETGGPVVVCLPFCDPIAQDCPADQGCYQHDDFWRCTPDASGDAGAYGDPCEFINVCDPGLVCADAGTVPPGLPCEGMAGCCTEICDLDDPSGDQQCAGVAGGQACISWYGMFEAPLPFEDVGVCAVPA